VQLTGWEGAPGLNTIMWTKGTLTSVGPEDVENWHDDILACYDAAKGAYVDSVTATVLAQVDVIDVASGDITGSITSAGGDVSVTQSTVANSKLSRATQINIALLTDVWANSRRLAGRMFFGPVQSEVFDEDGQIGSTTLGVLSDSFGVLNTGTGPRWAVYHRPGIVANSGYYGDITSVNPKPKPAVLRSRRD